MKTKDQLINLGLTDIQADDVMLLESEMFKRAVRFQFKKKDGSTREAVGTLIREKMVQADGSVWEPVGAERPDVPTLVKYWDLTVQGWRSFNVFNLLAVEG